MCQAWKALALRHLTGATADRAGQKTGWAATVYQHKAVGG